MSAFWPKWPLSQEELEAEQLFLEAMQFRISHREAVTRARELERRSSLAGGYLKWLLTLAWRGGGDVRKVPLTIAV